MLGGGWLIRSATRGEVADRYQSTVAGPPAAPPQLFARPPARPPTRPHACATLPCRLLSLEFSSQKSIKSAHTGAVTGLDLDHVEQRYLLAGAADASLAIYDTQQPTPPDALLAAEEQEYVEEQQGSQQRQLQLPPAAAAARAAGGGGAAAGEHQALARVTKQTPGGHRFSVSCVAWYPVDTGLFMSGARVAAAAVAAAAAAARLTHCDECCRWLLPALVMATRGLLMPQIGTPNRR